MEEYPLAWLLFVPALMALIRLTILRGPLLSMEAFFILPASSVTGIFTDLDGGNNKKFVIDSAYTSNTSIISGAT